MIVYRYQIAQQGSARYGMYTSKRLQFATLQIYMTIIQGAGFNIAKAARNLSDLYVIAIRFYSDSYCVISPTYSTLSAAMLIHGRQGQVIIKLPQGYNTLPYVVKGWYSPKGAWGRAIEIFVGETVFYDLPSALVNAAGVPIDFFDIETCNLIPSGFPKSTPTNYKRGNNVNTQAFGDPTYIIVYIEGRGWMYDDGLSVELQVFSGHGLAIGGAGNVFKVRTIEPFLWILPSNASET